MKQLILAGILMFSVHFFSVAQFVGNGAEKPASAMGPAGKMAFTVKVGTAIPLSPFSTIPQRTNPQYLSGVMGAKPGFFSELGFGIQLSNPDKMVGFYYFPILASFLQTPLDWSELGGSFTDKNNYTKPFSILDIAQRYGISVKPADDLSLALYYRPGLIIPFKYEIISSDNSFLFTGEMTTSDDAPVFMMSHTGGISIRYKLAAISVEKYSAKPTFDITYKDNDPTVHLNEGITGKIPVKLLLISLALNF